MTFGLYIMLSEPISMAYFINLFQQSVRVRVRACVCVCVCPLTVARKRLGKNVTAATNTHIRME
jgi:hypothetical protein